MIFDVENIRKDFPILERKVWDKPLIYFDSAATTQKPKVVIDSIVRYYEEYNSNIHRGMHKLADEATTAYENVRDKVKSFVNAPNAEVIFTRNTTESLNLLAYSIGEDLSAGDEVILSEMEHHANLVPWFILKERKGIVVKFIPLLEDLTLKYDELEKLITSKTKIISLTQKSNVLGVVNDINKISKLINGKNITLIVDAAQSAPHMKVDFSVLNCDFLCFSAHKILGPTGVGVLVGKTEKLKQMKPFLGGGEMISTVTFDGYTTNDLPYKFEAGTPNIADVIAMGEAIDYLEKIGMENIYAYESELSSYAYEKLQSFQGIKIFSKPASGLLTFAHSEIHPNDFATLLDRNGIAIRAGHHCAQPLMKKLGITATVRASFYIYNTKKEIDVFIQAMINAFEMFGVEIYSKK